MLSPPTCWRRYTAPTATLACPQSQRWSVPVRWRDRQATCWSVGPSTWSERSWPSASEATDQRVDLTCEKVSTAEKNATRDHWQEHHGPESGPFPTRGDRQPADEEHRQPEGGSAAREFSSRRHANRRRQGCRRPGRRPHCPGPQDI